MLCRIGATGRRPAFTPVRYGPTATQPGNRHGLVSSRWPHRRDLPGRTLTAGWWRRTRREVAKTIEWHNRGRPALGRAVVPCAITQTLGERIARRSRTSPLLLSEVGLGTSASGRARSSLWPLIQAALIRR